MPLQILKTAQGRISLLSVYRARYKFDCAPIRAGRDRIGLLALCHTVVRRRFSCAVYRFVVARCGSNAWCFVTHQCGADPAARDCAAQVRLPPLRSRARCKFDCAPLRGGGSANQTVRASLYYCTARVFGYATYRYVSVRRNLNLIIRRS